MYIKDVCKGNHYRGIERKGVLLSCLCKKDIQNYLQLVDPDGFIPYSAANITTLKRLGMPYNQCEIILFGKERYDKLDNESPGFLGYDVSGNSCNLSVIRRVFFECKNKNYHGNDYDEYLKKLNTNGLFSNYFDAISFIRSIDSIIEKQCLDYDENYCPFFVYCLA